jgi:hypothetical protein
MSRPAFLDEAQGEKPPVNLDRLDAIREKAREYRDTLQEKEDAEQRLTDLNKKIEKIKFSELPDLMSEARVPEFVLEAEGNMPEFKLKAKPYYYANIKADDPNAPAAFEWLEEEGLGSIIKRTYTVTIDKTDSTSPVKLEAYLEGSGYEYEKRLGVPWNTLTAIVKKLVEVHKVIPPLELMNGKIGRVVDFKPVKEKKPSSHNNEQTF